MRHLYYYPLNVFARRANLVTPPFAMSDLEAKQRGPAESLRLVAARGPRCVLCASALKESEVPCDEASYASGLLDVERPAGLR